MGYFVLQLREKCQINVHFVIYVTMCNLRYHSQNRSYIYKMVIMFYLSCQTINHTNYPKFGVRRSRNSCLSEIQVFECISYALAWENYLFSNQNWMWKDYVAIFTTFVTGIHLYNMGYKWTCSWEIDFPAFLTFIKAT